MTAHPERFWETKTLDELSDQQWESLCDGCGLCCLQKLEDEDTGELFYTRIACRMLDDSTARCRDYKNRFESVPDCVSMRPLTDEKRQWLPESCAYRRIAEGRGLAEWHPLISQSSGSVVEAGRSVASKTLAESEVPVHRWQDYVIDLDDFVAGVHRAKEA